MGAVCCNIASGQLSYMACILKQLGLKLLTNPWDGLTNLDIKWFGAMTRDTIALLCVKLPYNFGGWRDFLAFHNKFERLSQNIKTNTYLHKDLEMMTDFVELMQLRTF